MNLDNFLGHVEDTRYGMFCKAEDANDQAGMDAAEELHISEHEMQVVYDFTKDSLQGWTDKYAYQALCMMLKANGQEAKLAFVKKCWTKYRSKK